VADRADAHLDVVFVVEAQRRAVAHARLADREIEAARDEVTVVHHAECPQIRDAADLGEQEIVRVIHDALEVGLAVAHALAMREREIHEPRGG